MSSKSSMSIMFCMFSFKSVVSASNALPLEYFLNISPASKSISFLNLSSSVWLLIQVSISAFSSKVRAGIGLGFCAKISSLSLFISTRFVYSEFALINQSPILSGRPEPLSSRGTPSCGFSLSQFINS